VRASFSENKGDRGEGAAEKGKRESLLSTAISGNICCRTPLDLILFRSLSLPSSQPRPCFIALSFCGVCKVQSASPSPPAFCALTHTHINAIHTRPIAPTAPFQFNLLYHSLLGLFTVPCGIFAKNTAVIKLNNGQSWYFSLQSLLF